MRIGLADTEVRLLIDVLKGEEMRMHELIRDSSGGKVFEGDWYQKRLDAVGALKDRFKVVRK